MKQLMRDKEERNYETYRYGEEGKDEEASPEALIEIVYYV
jgi:hypothetical protein